MTRRNAETATLLSAAFFTLIAAMSHAVRPVARRRLHSTTLTDDDRDFLRSGGIRPE
jgi:hypothetical protein